MAELRTIVVCLVFIEFLIGIPATNIPLFFPYKGCENYIPSRSHDKEHCDYVFQGSHMIWWMVWKHMLKGPAAEQREEQRDNWVPRERAALARPDYNSFRGWCCSSSGGPDGDREPLRRRSRLRRKALLAREDREDGSEQYLQGLGEEHDR